VLPSYSYGHDFGNAETCGVLFERGIQRTICLPSMTALGSLQELVQKRSVFHHQLADTEADVLTSGEYVLEHAGNELFLGMLALKQARNATAARGDIGRYWSTRSLHQLLAASGSLVPHSEYQLNVVTGLPVETFVHADMRNKVKQALEGEHHFTLNGVRRLAVVHVMKTIMEGAGALIAYGATGGVMQGCIDPGGRTTDLFVAEGQTPILHLCRGKELGVEQVSSLLSSRFQAQYHRPLKPSETRELLHAHVSKRAYPAIHANGVQVQADELHHWLAMALTTIGNDIASFVGTVWNTSESGAVGSDIAIVLLVGGVAYYFAEALKARMPHLTIPPRPELANALGYAALADELSQRVQPVT
jgi:plasmid segregation protein ParM